MSYKDLYSNDRIIENYVKYRPSYPEELYTTIMKFLESKPDSTRHGQAVDVGCGPGHSTWRLADYFHTVLGTDISDSMIQQANISNTRHNIQYRQSACDSIPLCDDSVDLVTSGMAAHWFEPVSEFYKESDRVLKPGGVLALFGYSFLPTIQCEGYDSGQLSYLLWQFYADNRMQMFTRDRESLMLTHYRDFTLLYDECVRFECTNREEKTFSDVLGFVSSLHNYCQYKEHHGDQPDPLAELAHRYKKVLGEERPLEQIKCTICWPVYLVMARKPR